MKVKTDKNGTTTTTLTDTEKSRLASAHEILDKLGYHSHDESVCVLAGGLRLILAASCWMHPTTEAKPEPPAK